MKLRIYVVLAIFVAAVIAGWLGYRIGSRPPAAIDASVPADGADVAGEGKPLYWYDPMVPDKRFDQPGKSPFMDMQLVPKYADTNGDAGTVRIDPRMRQNLGIRTVVVESGMLAPQVRATGTVVMNERAIQVVQTRAAGWVERLAVRAEGDAVRRGQLLAAVYSPELLATQEEFLLARDAHDVALASAARNRMALLGITSRQIEQIARRGRAARQVEYYAPSDGVVVRLGTRVGMQVTPGMTLFELVDLSKVWITAEIPAAQAQGVAAGLPATASVAALRFAGRVDYVYPQVMAETRTLRVRIVLDNPDLALKPGQYAMVSLPAGPPRRALLVPSEALIRTGQRTVVIAALGDGRFRPVEVRSGVEFAGKVEVLSGLQEGQQVVASGQFLIDSEANLTSSLQRLDEAAP